MAILTNIKKYRAFAMVSLVLLLGVTSYPRIKTLFIGDGKLNTEQPSIAVLPFANLTNDPKQDVLCDGLTEGILNSLAQLDGLKVSSRNSSFRFRGDSVDIKAVGTQLSVKTILEGSFQIQGERVRVTAQLINVEDGFHFWSAQFDEKSDDVFSLEDKIASAIANKLTLTLLPGDKSKQLQRHINKEALQFYLEGRSAIRAGTPSDLFKAIDSFERAIKFDSLFARAYAGIADGYNGLGYGSYISPAEAFPKARIAAQKAMQLDSTLAEPHASLGFINFYFDWDWQAAEQEFRTAIGLNANYALAFEWYGYYLTAMQRYDEAMVVFQKALQLDPLSVPINTDMGFSLYYSGQYDSAINKLQKSIEMNPRSVPAHLWLGRSYQQQAKYPEAIEQYQQSLQVAKDWPVALAAMGNAFGVSGSHSEAEKSLVQLRELSLNKFVTSYGVALVYAGIGDKIHAIEWLEKAYDEKSNWLVWLRTDPRWKGIRTEQKFSELVGKVGLPKVAYRPQ